MFHCHMLSHEDDGMMGQFLVTGIPTGMNILGGNPEIKIYPNPVTDRLIVEVFGADRSPVTIEIRNGLGQLCFNQEISAFPVTLSTSTLKTGIYTASFIFKDRILVKKIIHF